jgi:hypothetical protein
MAVFATVQEDVMKTFRQHIEEQQGCEGITFSQLKRFEKYVDSMFDKYDIDFRLTKHFADRFSDDRNKPCIKPRELASFLMKIYKMKGRAPEKESRFGSGPERP